MITFVSSASPDHLLGNDLGATLAAGERRILESLYMLHRKLDALNNSDAALTTEVTALGTQLQSFEADITTGLASVVAALKSAGTPATDDPAVDAATTALNAMGVGITGSQTAFDAAVASAVPPASVPTPSVPTVPVTAPSTDAAAPTTAPIAQPVLDAMAANAVKAPEQSQ